MPELPEVETVKNVLQPRLVGKKIVGVDINNGAVIADAASEFVERLNGQAFSDIERRGKFLIFRFASGDGLVVHLRMTGCLTLQSAQSPTEKHTHVAIKFDGGDELRYSDVRRFGKLSYVESGALEELDGVRRLGVEPFDVTVEYLKSKICRSKKPIKSLLMEQGIIAGIGNIYSDEILFAAKINPRRAGASLSDGELLRLCKAIPEQLAYYIEKNKVSFEEYAESNGKSYRNTPYLRVYGKANMPCPHCGAPLIGDRIGGRSYVYCPNCQK